MSDSFDCDHRESGVDEIKLSRENWEDDIGDMDAKKKTHTLIQCYVVAGNLNLLALAPTTGSARRKGVWVMWS
jgi:hypothetical protein